MKSAHIFVQAILKINFDPTDEYKSGHINQNLDKTCMWGSLFLSPEKISNTVSMFYTCITIKHRSLAEYMQ